MFERDREDRVVVPFTGADAGTAPFGWGQKAIWQDMQESGNQFTMYGMMALPDGTVQDAAARLSGLMHRHAALRTRTITGQEGRPYQEVAGSGQIGLDILAIGDDVEPRAAHRAPLRAPWPLRGFFFPGGWPRGGGGAGAGGPLPPLVWGPPPP